LRADIAFLESVIATREKEIHGLKSDLSEARIRGLENQVVGAYEEVRTIE